MAKVKVDFSALRNQLINNDRVINKKTKKRLGKFLDKETKERIEVGTSPVKGVGRFKPYAIQRKGSGYPRDVKRKFPSKKDRPINLHLDGTFLNNIGFKLTKFGIEYGLISKKKLMKDMFDTHNNGTHPHVPQRKFLPNKKGDKYTTSIMKGIKNIYNLRISNIIKRMNKKNQ